MAEEGLRVADEDIEHDEGANPLVRVREVLGIGGDLTLDDVSERSGLPLTIVRDVFRAAGRTDRDGYGERDVEYAERIARLLDYYPLDTVVRAVRARDRAITSIVVSDLSAVRDSVVGPALAEGADIDELTARLVETADVIVPIVESLLSDHYRDALYGLLDSDVVVDASRTGGNQVDLAVGFVDLVGYTELSVRTDPGGLDEVLRRFEDIAHDVAGRADGVLLAKFVGDAAMFVGESPVDVAEVILDLVDRRQIAEAPRRGGMAAGPVLVREGDYFGESVNLAARLTDHARPWTLLADQELEDDLSGYDLTRIPTVELRGLGERRPYRLRPAREE